MGIKEFFAGLFGSKDMKPEAQPLNREYYQIGQTELAWAVDKVLQNQRKYETRWKLTYNGSCETWQEYAALHYIIFRLNFGQLNMLKPSGLGNYKDHYYYEAGMKLLAELNKHA